MNRVELEQALRKLCLSGMADILETPLQQAEVEQMVPIDLVAALVADEPQRRQDRLLAGRHKQARFRDPERSLDGFDFAFNKKINRALVFELATARFVAQREDALLSARPAQGRAPWLRPSAAPHPAGLPRHLPRSPRLPRGTRRGDRAGDGSDAQCRGEVQPQHLSNLAQGQPAVRQRSSLLQRHGGSHVRRVVPRRSGPTEGNRFRPESAIDFSRNQ